MLIAECTSLARRIFPQFCCYRALTLRALRCPCLPQTFRRSVLAQRFRAFSICSKTFILHPSSDSALPRNQCWVYMAPGKTLGGCDNVWKNRSWRDAAKRLLATYSTLCISCQQGRVPVVVADVRSNADNYVVIPAAVNSNFAGAHNLHALS